MIPINPINPIGGVSGVGGVRTDYSPAVSGYDSADGALPEASGDTEEVKQKKRLGVIECQTCATRTYQDGSDDPGVSFKAPTKLTPNEAASAVPSHEREHFNREAAKADEEDREVISNSIRIFTSVCPECGKTYVAGGVTTTVTKSKEDEESEALKKLMGIDDGEDRPDSVKNLGVKIANEAYGLNFDEKG